MVHGNHTMTAIVKAISDRRTLIPAITTDDGTLHDDPQTIADAFATFLSCLYTRHDRDIHKQDMFINNLRRHLDAQQRAALSAPFVIAELNSVRRNLPKNKVPGPDRLPYEFYTCVWSHVQNPLLDIANTIAESGICPDDMNLSTIVMKYKQGNRCQRTNYRPLSLSNTDYKITAKLLAARTNRVLPSIIHANQHGFVKGRSIGDAVLLLKLLEEYCLLEDESMIAFMSDISKAYDTADRGFLRKVLVAFGFPLPYLRCFDAFHSTTQAQVLANGALSSRFSVQSGVRQGCPWAPMLFVMMAETLAETIRSDPHIEGVTVHVPYNSTIANPQEFVAKFSAFADDALTMMKDWHGYRHVQAVFADYGAASGNYLNLSKSKCYLVGRSSQNNAVHLQDIAPTLKLIDHDGFLLYLGVPFGASVQHYWQDKLTVLQSKLKRLQSLNLSVFGRAATGRAYALSSVLYPFRFTNDPVASSLVIKINSIYRNFVLNNKAEFPIHPGTECYRMSVKDAALHPKYGGVGLLDVPVYLSAIRFKTLLQLLLTPDSTAVYLIKAVANSCTKPFFLGIHALFLSHAYVTRLLKSSRCLTALHEYVVKCPLHRRITEITRAVAMREPIFFNPVVTLDPQDFGLPHRVLLSWKRIATAGFTHVAHFLRQDYPLVKQQWLAQLRRVRETEHKLQAIMAAVLQFNLPDSLMPTQQNTSFSVQFTDVMCTWLNTWRTSQTSPRTLADISTKQLYNSALLIDKPTKPRCIRQWEYLQLPPPLLTLRYSWFKDIWHMHLPRKWLDTLYAVLNNTLPTYNKVKHVRAQDSCPLCTHGPDSPNHILFGCVHVRQVWIWAQQVYAYWQSPHTRMFTDAISFPLWLSTTLDSHSLPQPWKWFFWCAPVLRALWFSRNSRVYKHQAWSMTEIKEYCITQWLTGALLMCQHHPYNDFLPLISVNSQSAQFRWLWTG